MALYANDVTGNQSTTAEDAAAMVGDYTFRILALNGRRLSGSFTVDSVTSDKDGEVMFGSTWGTHLTVQSSDILTLWVESSSVL